MPENMSLQLWAHKTHRCGAITTVEKDAIQTVIEGLASGDVEDILHGKFLDAPWQPLCLNYTTASWRRNIDALRRCSLAAMDGLSDALFRYKDMHVRPGDFHRGVPGQPRTRQQPGPIQLIEFLDGFRKEPALPRATAPSADAASSFYASRTCGKDAFNDWMRENSGSIDIVEIKLAENGVRLLYRALQDHCEAV